jgi:hypothetical protein
MSEEPLEPAHDAVAGVFCDFEVGILFGFG